MCSLLLFVYGVGLGGGEVLMSSIVVLVAFVVECVVVCVRFCSCLRLSLVWVVVC